MATRWGILQRRTDTKVGTGGITRNRNNIRKRSGKHSEFSLVWRTSKHPIMKKKGNWGIVVFRGGSGGDQTQKDTVRLVNRGKGKHKNGRVNKKKTKTKPKMQAGTKKRGRSCRQRPSLLQQGVKVRAILSKKHYRRTGAQFQKVYTEQRKVLRQCRTGENRTRQTSRKRKKRTHLGSVLNQNPFSLRARGVTRKAMATC